VATFFACWAAGDMQNTEFVESNLSYYRNCSSIFDLRPLGRSISRDPRRRIHSETTNTRSKLIEAFSTRPSLHLTVGRTPLVSVTLKLSLRLIFNKHWPQPPQPNGGLFGLSHFSLAIYMSLVLLLLTNCNFPEPSEDPAHHDFAIIHLF
jgi:hypothetical protein